MQKSPVILQPSLFLEVFKNSIMINLLPIKRYQI